MGDEHQRRLPPPLQAEQQIDDLLAGRAVEVAGRLVGQDDLRARAAARARWPPAAARRPRAAPGNDRRDAPGRPRRARPRAASNASAWPANSSGSATFSSAVMVGTRWNDWKTMPILAPAHERQLVLAESPEIVADNAHRARGCPLEAGDDHQQGGLARTAGADDGDRFARRHRRDRRASRSPQARRGSPASGTRLSRAMTGFATFLEAFEGLSRVWQVSTSVKQAGAWRGETT